MISYHKYKYFVTFYDEFTSHGWIVLLKQKNNIFKAIKHFNALVATQHKSLVKEFMTDAGGEYKLLAINDYLKDLGIKSLQSVPHIQNS